MKGDLISKNPPEIMTIGETAQYLRISQSSLYKLAQEGRIPCQNVGRHWRFCQETIDRGVEQTPGIQKTEQKNQTNNPGD
jgi:excisionase family DNA binding protein